MPNGPTRGAITCRFVAVCMVAMAGSPTLLSMAWAESRLGIEVAPDRSVSPPIATAVRLEDSGEYAKLVFDLSAPIDATAFVLAAPDRVVVDLPQIDFLIAPEVGRPAKTGRPGGSPRRRGARSLEPGRFVASFRFGWLGPGKSRIVIDLDAPARIVSAKCEPVGAAKPSLVIELARTDRASFRAAAQIARVNFTERGQSDAAQTSLVASGKPIVVIDPGHGGIDSGAIVNGLTEKTLVLDFAKAVTAKLEADGRFAVVMTRQDDRFVSLAERVKTARDSNALLFVSFHADTVSEATDVAGATAYTVSDRASDAEAARLAEKENQADVAAGLDGTEDASDVSDILHDLTRRETRALSHVFARTLLNYWKIAGRLNKNPQRSAGFRVLKAPDVPSVLFELGYLSNQKDDVALSSVEWREKASSRVAEAIAAFFAARENAVAVTAADAEKAHSDPLSKPR